MRFPIPLKLITLAVLGVGTVFATKAILAEAPVDERPREKITVTKTEIVPGNLPRQARPRHPRTSATCSIGRVECRTIGGMIHVAAEAGVYDRRPDFRYAWSFRLFDADDKQLKNPLYQKIYDNQVIAPQELQGPLTFRDIIPASLPPGRYAAELALSAFSAFDPRFGLDAVRDPRLSQGRIKSATRRIITIE